MSLKESWVLVGIDQIQFQPIDSMFELLWGISCILLRGSVMQIRLLRRPPISDGRLAMSVYWNIFGIYYR
jgi:hypothetical protein